MIADSQANRAVKEFRWRTRGDLLALSCIWLCGALTLIAAAGLVSMPPPVFPRPIDQTPVELPLSATPHPTPMFAAIPAPTRPLWQAAILMGPCRKPLRQMRCTPEAMPSAAGR